jgi:hypothetical protein
MQRMFSYDATRRLTVLGLCIDKGFVSGARLCLDNKGIVKEPCAEISGEIRKHGSRLFEISLLVGRPGRHYDHVMSFTPLGYAIERNDLNMAKLLLRKGCSPDARCRGEKSKRLFRFFFFFENSKVMLVVVLRSIWSLEQLQKRSQ